MGGDGCWLVVVVVICDGKQNLVCSCCVAVVVIYNSNILSGEMLVGP